MGQNLKTMYYDISHPDTAPDGLNPPTFDPQLGFSEEREPRSKKTHFIFVYFSFSLDSTFDFGNNI